MEITTIVNYDYTDNIYKAKKWLNNLPDMIACDFEAASKYTQTDKNLFQLRLDKFRYSKEDERNYKQMISSNGLSHPSLSVITHFSVAWSDRDSYVIVCSNNGIRKVVFDFLSTTDRLQLWHNGAGYDFRHIIYNTGVKPKNFIDTMLLAKCISNDANSGRDKVGLKVLMGYKYGAWALAKDEEDTYTLENMWNPDMIKYAATDSPACYCLYQDIQNDLTKWSI